VREICKKYGLQKISFSVNKQDYDEIVPESFRKDSGWYHYTWAIRHILAHTAQWHIGQGINHPLEYVFDWMGEKRKNPRRKEIEDVMDQAEEDAAAKGRADEYEHWSFRRRAEVPGLQCVEALAWTVYQYGLLAFYKKPLTRDAQIAWNDFGKDVGGPWGFDVTVARENLKKWIGKESADGISVKRFAAWREKKHQSPK